MDEEFSEDSNPPLDYISSDDEEPKEHSPVKEHSGGGNTMTKKRARYENVLPHFPETAGDLVALDLAPDTRMHNTNRVLSLKEYCIEQITGDDLEDYREDLERIPFEDTEIYTYSKFLPWRRFYVPATINRYLFEFQRTGVRFLFDLFQKGQGGVLNDDMGLGKTIQTIAFIAALLRKTGREDIDKPYLSKINRNRAYRNFKPILVVTTEATMLSWLATFEMWGYFNVELFGKNPFRSRREQLEEIDFNQVWICNYSMMRHLLHVEWKVVVFDEVQKLKNIESQTNQQAHSLKSTCKIGLTGTLIANNLLEPYALFRVLCPALFDSMSKKQYHKLTQKITTKDATPEEIIQHEEALSKVQECIKGCTLRRTKEDELCDFLPGKDDFIILCPLTPAQERVYIRALQSPDFYNLVYKVQAKRILRQVSEADAALGIPANQRHLEKGLENGPIWKAQHRGAEKCCQSCGILCINLPCQQFLSLIANHLQLLINDKSKFAESIIGDESGDMCGKMNVLEAKLREWHKTREKALVFSSSISILDIISKRLKCRYLRIDGKTKHRQELVDEFNRDENILVFLISTKAGGEGLNLTSASKVVIFNPDWNPAYDRQAQDRAYRLGQKKEWKSTGLSHKEPLKNSRF